MVLPEAGKKWWDVATGYNKLDERRKLCHPAAGLFLAAELFSSECRLHESLDGLVKPLGTCAATIATSYFLVLVQHPCINSVIDACS